jgi:glycosyltransferase involved in cell wall biosynthesis
VSPSPGPPVSAYIPCFNNAATIRIAAESLIGQSIPLAEILVVDDGSAYDIRPALRGCDVRIVRHDSNLGRGAARARAMQEARHDLVLCCDATNVLESGFLEKALPWFDDPGVAAVFGRITQPSAANAANRWRGRHLFKIGAAQAVRHGALLATYGAVVRRSAVRHAGGYDASLRHTEDGDLGERLLAAQFDVICDPRLEITAIAPNTLGEVLERYWRWYAGAHETVSWRSYWKAIGYSIRSLAAADVREGDLLGVPLSLITPHYQFWRSWLRQRRAAGPRR